MHAGCASTKWLDFGAGGVGGAGWVEWRALVRQAPVEVVAYDLVSANDAQERDPAAWVLEGMVAVSGNSSSSSGISCEWGDPTWRW